MDRVQKRAKWLNDFVFADRPIDDEAVAAMVGMGVPRAMELFKDIEEKSDQIKNPSGYLKGAARREGFGPAGGGAGGGSGGSKSKGKGNGKGEDQDYGKVHKRATWLNVHVFADNPIDDEAIAAVAGMGIPRAMELFKEIEEKAGQLRNPSGYLKTAARREALGPLEGRGGRSPKGGGKGVYDEGKVQRRALWLNSNVFTDRPIDDEAIAAVAGISVPRAMELFKELEEKGDQVRNPSGYLVTAANRENVVPVAYNGASKGSSKGHEGKIETRAAWLNANVFLDNPIDDDAVAAMVGMGISRAMELFKEIEEKSGTIRNPSGYLKNAAKKEGFAPFPDWASAKGSAKGSSKGSKALAALPALGKIVIKAQAGSASADPAKLVKRAAWLSDKIFTDNGIDEETVAAMEGLTMARAMELFKDIESRADNIKDPNKWLQAAVQRELGGKGQGIKRRQPDGLQYSVPKRTKGAGKA